MTLRRGTIACSSSLAVFLLVATYHEARSGRVEEVELFRRGWEAFDFGRWGKAALYFSAALDANPREGSVRPFDSGHSPHIQVPYLPHFFFGATLFELGRYEEALEEWQLSASGASGALRTPVAKREQKKLRSLVERFRTDELPESLLLLSTAVEQARPAIEALEQASEGLAPQDRQSIRAAMATLEDSLPSGDTLAALAQQIASQQPASGRRDPVEVLLARYQEAVGIHRRLSAASRTVAEALHKLDELYATTRQLLLEGLRERSRSPTLTSALLPAPGHPRTGIDPTPALARDSAVPAGLLDQQRRWSEYVQAKLLVDSGACYEMAIDLLESSSRPVGSPAPFAIEGLAWEPDLYLAKAYKNCNRKREAQRTLARLGPRADDEALLEVRAWAESHDPWYTGNSYALVVGAWRYEHWPPLPGVEDDYRALLEVLDRQGFTTTGLPNPTIQTLKQEFARMKGQLRPDDLFLFYYAGHGYAAIEERRGIEEGIFVGVDAPPPPSRCDRDARAKYGIKLLPSNERSTAFGYSMTDFEDWATRELKARHVILFIDSCFSGSVINQAGINTQRMPPVQSAPSYLERALRNPATLFITAGTADERVPSVSPFRLALVTELEGSKPGTTSQEPDAPLGYLYGSLLAQKLMIRATTKMQTPIARMVEGQKAGDIVFRVPGAWTSEERSTGVGELYFFNALMLSAIWNDYHEKRDYTGYLQKASEGSRLTHRDFQALATEFLHHHASESAPAKRGAL